MALSTPLKPPIVSAQTSNSGEFTGGGHGKVALSPAFLDRGILRAFLASLLLPPHFASFVGCTDEVLDNRDMARLLLWDLSLWPMFVFGLRLAFTGEALIMLEPL